MINQSEKPFIFCTRLSLTAATGVKAADLSGLLDGIKHADESSIYQHTHRFIREHEYLVPEPANDFAVWVENALREPRLAERLASVDPFAFPSLAAIREAFVSAIEEHLASDGPGRYAPTGDAFHFIKAIRFSMPTRHQARTLSEFADGIKKITGSSIFLHLFESRLRLAGSNDFSVWLAESLQEKELAEKIAGLTIYSSTLEELRAQILVYIEEKAAEHA